MPAESVKSSAISGLRWLLLNRVVGEVLGVGFAVALARLVSPAQFGHAAVALLFALLAVILTYEGSASALVQRAEVEERHRQVAVLMSLVVGLVLTGFVFALAELVLPAIFGHETASLVALISPTFLIAAVGSVSRATLWRELDFRAVTRIDLISIFSGNVCAVVLAVLGLEAEALVIGAMATTAVTSLLLMLKAPEPLPRWHRSAARDIAGFGASSVAANLAQQLFWNVDYWIVAARLTAFQTGIYYRAFNVGVVYQSKISNVMMQLAFPVYSRVEDRGEMRRLHERAARIHAVVIFPLLALLIVLAPVAIPFVFGSQWTPAVRPAQILAVAGMIAAVLTGYPQVMMAVGKPQTLMRFNLVMLVTYAAAISVAASHGLIAVSIAVVIVYVAILLGAYQFLLRPHLGLSLRRLIPEMGPAVAGSLVLIAVCMPLRVAMERSLPAVVVLALIGVAGLAVYALVLRLIFRSTWGDVTNLALRVAPRLSLGRRGAGSAASATVAS